MTPCDHLASRCTRELGRQRTSRARIICLLAGAAALAVLARVWNTPGDHGDAEGVWLWAAVATHGARCLDGSPPLYYISYGYGEERHKWLIHHEGGDWCDRLERTTQPGERPNWSCLERSDTALGSSAGHSPSLNLAAEYGDRFEYFSRDPARNPLHAWTHVLLRYCDGGSYSGDVPEEEGPFLPGRWFGTRRLFFRGKAALQAVMRDLLDKRGLRSATDVVLGGASAGGLGILLQADEWRIHIFEAAALHHHHPPKLAVMLDAAIFPAHEDTSSAACHYETRMRAVHRLHKPSSPTLARCEAANPEDPASCMFGARLLPHVQTPAFVFSSLFDGWMLQHVTCNASSASIQAFGTDLRDSILSVVQGTQHGAFLDDCRHHTKCWADVKIGRQTAGEAFSRWYAQLGGAPQESGAAEATIWQMKGEYASRRCNRFYHKSSCPVTQFRR